MTDTESQDKPFLSESNRFPYWVLLFLAIWTISFSALSPRARVLGPDDWSYFELSSTVFVDFFHVNTVRQFVKDLEYSNSVPPLWPVILATARCVCDSGISTGSHVNALVGIVLAWSCIKLLRDLGQPGWIGSLVYFAIFAQPQFCRDFWAGGPIPLACVWLIVNISIASNPKPKIVNAIALGVFSGLGLLTRFDFAPIAVVLAIHAVIRIWQKSGLGTAYKYAIIMAIAGLITISPWIYYNIVHFGTPLASDNGRQLMSIRPIHVMDYFGEMAAPTLTTDPLRWIRGAFTEKLILLGIGAYWGVLIGSWIPAILVVRIIVERPVLRSPPMRTFANLTLILLPAMLVPAWLTGYGRDGNGRYFIGAILLVTALLISQIAERLESRILSRTSRLALIAIIATLATCQGFQAYSSRVKDEKSGKVYISGLTHEMIQLDRAVRREEIGSDRRLLVASGIDPFAFGALTGIRTCPLPYSGDWKMRSLIKDYRIALVYDPDGKRPPADDVVLIPLEFPGLYQVDHSPKH